MSDRGDRRHPHGGAVPLAGRRRARRASARARRDRRASTTSTGGRTPPTAASCSSRSRRKCPARCALIEHLVAAGVRVAIGHTAATPQQIARRDRRRRDAGDASRQRLRADAAAASERDLGAAGGRRGLRQLHRRRPPPAAGDRESDGSREGRATDDPRDRRDGRRRLRARHAISIGGVDCELGADGRVSLPGTPYLAGSSLTLDRAIANTVRFTGLPIEDVIPMASTIPAAYLGMTTAGTVTADWDAATASCGVCRRDLQPSPTCR